MTNKLSILRVAGPTIMVSLILFAACIVSAIILYRLHADTAADLAEDIDSRKIAAEMETTLRNLATLVRNGSDQVDALHENLWDKFIEARELADTDQEIELESRVEASFDRYHRLWATRLDDDNQPMAAQVKAAIAVLESETLPAVVRLRNHNMQQMEKSEAALKRTVKWIAWALVGVGTIGSLGGILLGYGVARALRHSITRLSVRIRDAADKLGQDLPTVTLSEAGGIDYLHEQMQGLMREIEQTVQRLQQREMEVLRAEQLAAVGQLAAGVAHELRNPLTAVKMLVQASREEMETRGLPAEDMQVIEQEIRRLEQSLQTFLDFARPPKMVRRRVDLGGIVEEAVTLLGGRARKQNVEIAFARPSGLLFVEADGEQLRQLLINLAMNALDAMPQGGTLGFTVSSNEQGQVEVKVTDTGPGIGPEILPRLFEPFASGKETGLGLGLVLSRRIAEDHGGSLSAGNGPCGGACFTLHLPPAEEPAAVLV